MAGGGHAWRGVGGREWQGACMAGGVRKNASYQAIRTHPTGMLFFFMYLVMTYIYINLYITKMCLYMANIHVFAHLDSLTD